MRKFRILLVAALFCVAGYNGYTAYEKANMTTGELALLENVEALSYSDTFDGGDSSNLRWAKHPRPGWWFLNGSERCCIQFGEGNSCERAGECTGV